MSEKTPHRRPATFKLDDPGVVVMGPDETGRPARGTVHITPEADPATLPVPIDAPLVPARRGFRWGTLFWSAVGGLVLLASGLGVANLIEDLFARSETLGYVALAFAAGPAGDILADHNDPRVAAHLLAQRLVQRLADRFLRHPFPLRDYSS